MEETRHPLRGLLLAQFLGTFNDSLWRMIVVLLAFAGLEQELAGASEAAVQAGYQSATTTAMIAFMVPFVMFSFPAGVLADRVSKRTVIVGLKFTEICLMAAALGLLILAPGGGWPALLIVCCMGMQSALFSPAKEAILPEILTHERLSYGNGLMQLTTFVAIIGGTGAAGPLLGWSGDRVWIVGMLLLTCSVIGFVGALAVPKMPAARAAGGLVATVSSSARTIASNRTILFTVVGLVLFGTIGSLLLQNVLVYGRAILELGALATMPSAILAIGIGVGSVLAIKLSAGKVEYGLIPLGAMGVGFLVLLQGSVAPGLNGTLVLMMLGGVAGGLIVVPLEALLQWQSPAEHRGGIIALSNIFVSVGTLSGSVGVAALSGQLSTTGIFLMAALVALAGTVWALWLLPEAFVRLLAILVTHTVYRIDVRGKEHVPERGEALLLPNHVSLADVLFILASTDRRVRFVLAERLFDMPVLGRILRLLGAIPLPSSGGPRAVLKAMKQASERLDAGQVVCLFPEGEITRTGMMLPFRQGFDRMLKGRDTPVIPVHLDGVWGSIFSREGGRFVWKIPKRLPYPVSVTFGEPMPADTPVHEVRRTIRELGVDAWVRRKAKRPPLHRSFIRNVRRRPRALAFADATRPKVSRFGALVGSIALARRLRSVWGDDDHVGILLPPSVAGALVNLAGTLSGRTVVNLNYTAGMAGMESAARQAGLRSVVTSKAFVEKADLELPGSLEPLWISEIAGSISTPARIVALLTAIFAPAWLIERVCGARRKTSMDDTVAVIFSSGSTGEPKGVCLSHFNLDANVEAAAQVFHLLPDDRILGVLPLFHSFGYMTTLWFAVNHGLGVVFHPNPLDAPAHGELIEKYRITMIASTPTFLQIYMKRTEPGQLGSLRVALVGAEKLHDRVADAFRERFGISPLEGYGATECSPIIAVSVPDQRMPGSYQVGSRDGFLGRAIPGIALRVVDPEGPDDDLEPLPPETPGMLLVRGANVMQGYLGRDDLTSKALRDGWYVTGDIAMVDSDGFVRITDRLSRFSKIGGEMVPHGRVEEVLHQVAGIEHQVFAVTAVPDEKKGEKLAVLHTVDPEDVPGLIEGIKEAGLPNLFIPRSETFIQVDELPLLGTGKIDLRALKRTATETLGG